jgi:hypothetical protein
VYGTGIVDVHALGGRRRFCTLDVERVEEFVASLTEKFHMPSEDAAASAENLRAAAARCMLERM